jgi:argininosuccinate lyase
MTSTGRIKRGVRSEIAAIVFGATSDAAIDTELSHYTTVDLAHVIALFESGVVGRDAARKLIAGLLELRRSEFVALRGRPAPRGLYLLYESYLIEELGESVAGWLQTGRSRNDLSATVARLRMRPLVSELVVSLAELAETSCRVGAATAGAVMPAYTHYQPAVPTTFGHYCTGAALALLRDWSGIDAALAEIDTCPLGACAVGGTSLPIDASATARRLGFVGPALNSIDAVASRDFVLRLLAACAILGVTMSRVAGDLLLWSTQELGFLHLPDHVIGSSSMMPQKRNPFLLEHVQGRAGLALGAFCGAATAMNKAPFSNSVAVGTEGVSGAWGTLKSMAEAAVLLNEVLSAAEPRLEVMADRAERGFTAATRCAELLALAGTPFRVAHHAVGELVTQALGSATGLSDVAAGLLPPDQLPELQAARACEAARYGGGPAAQNVHEALASLAQQRAALSARQEARSQRWREAARLLNAEAERFVALPGDDA